MSIFQTKTIIHNKHKIKKLKLQIKRVNIWSGNLFFFCSLLENEN